jgi:hypothetical protein
MCQREAHDRLPNAVELEELDGLVIVAPSSARGFPAPEIKKLSTTPRASGSPIPMLAITSDATLPDPRTSEVPWRRSIALSELAEFVQKLRQPAAVGAAA